MADDSKTPKPADKPADLPKVDPTPVKPEPARAPEPRMADEDAHKVAMIAAKVVAEMAASGAKAPSRVANSDKTVPGGKYIVGDVVVNAWGKPFREGQDPAQDDPEMSNY